MCGSANPATALQHSTLHLFDLVHDLGNRPDLDGPIASPPGLGAELHLDRAVFADLAVVSFEPAVVIVVPLVHDAVADKRVLAVTEFVRLILAFGFPFALELLAAILDVRLDGGIFRIACRSEYAARPILSVAGADP